MKIATFDSGILWDDPNFYWGDPSYLLEPGDPGYVPPISPTHTKPKKPQKKRKYMASKNAPADTAPVKLLNTQGTQQTFEGLPAGATVAFTVTGVNDAGEGAASDPVSVVVT